MTTSEPAGAGGERPAICLAGPMLGRHPGWVVSQGEILAELLAERGHRIHLTSTVRNPWLRTADIACTLAARRRSIDVTVLMVFSGRGFATADVASSVARRLRQPLILVLRGGNLPTFVRRYPRWSARVLRRAELLVAPSPYLADRLPDFGPPITVIPNVLRLERYPYRQRRELAPKLLWMRTFHDIYRPDMALDVLARLRLLYPGATLTMAGQDAGRLAATRGRARGLGLDRAVRFVGFLDGEGKRREFGRHDVFLNTNRIDNMPVSVVEAAAFGLPVVATAVGGIPYLLRDGETGLLVDDAEGMSAAVAQLLVEPELAARLSANGRRLAETCAWSALVEQWDAAFVRVLRQRQA